MVRCTECDELVCGECMPSHLETHEDSEEEVEEGVGEEEERGVEEEGGSGGEGGAASSTAGPTLSGKRGANLDSGNLEGPVKGGEGPASKRARH